MQGLYKDKYRIKSTRLKDFDYSSNGAYSVTMCTKNRECHFGHVINGEIKLSDMGKIVEQCWHEIPQHFENVILDEFVVMPNHVHGIITIDDDYKRVECCRDAINRVSTGTIMINEKQKRGGITKNYNPMLSKSLSTIIRWYKGRATYQINKMQNEIFFQWQPRFYEHVIRNDEELNRIREYIINNPVQWELDDENPKNCRL